MSEKIVIAVGSVYEGKVVRLKPFGAIVSLPDNSQGLVHISHISSSYVQNVEDHLAVGDAVKVKVISNDPATGKISLSMKDIEQSESMRERAAALEHESRTKDRRVEGGTTFEDKFKEFVKSSNERQAGLNKRNKRR
ncbi:MAG: S1 RNA-binding domain-containing protein [Clostridiales bacterium]|nr:S1 RNA-binding domain-containing protein [Clostridiales bacterium]